jgi:hypothetical protein
MSVVAKPRQDRWPSATPESDINWGRDIEVLRDLTLTVPRSHELAGEAFWDQIARAAERNDAVVEQKVLMARLAAESISATEDLGALVWAISQRRSRGILDAYLSYQPGSVRGPVRRLRAGDSLVDVLELPSIIDVESRITPDDVSAYAKAATELEAVLKVAASNYLRESPNLVKTYNKVKHGFVVVLRMNALIPGAAPSTNWRDDVNVLSGIDQIGNISFTAIERSASHMEQLLKVIKMCDVAL